MVKKVILFLPFFFTILLQAEAQSFFNYKKERKLIAIVGTGMASYFGELNNPYNYFDITPNLVLGAQYKVHPHISVRSEFTSFMLSGDDSKAPIETGRLARNLSFYSFNFEINGAAVFYLKANHGRYYRRPNQNYYGFVGLGALYYNPLTNYNGQTYALRPLQTELISYTPFSLVIPMGLGYTFQLNHYMNLSIEGGYRLTFTDYLDDVSTVHRDPSLFPDPIARALSDRRPELGLEPKQDGFIRGNPNRNDAYWMLNVKVEYYLPPTFLQGTSGPKYRGKKPVKKSRYR
jgi:hypothetical protein